MHSSEVATSCRNRPCRRPFIVEGKIDPKDIAKIKQGDDVKISLTAYDPSKFGRVDGSTEQSQLMRSVTQTRENKAFRRYRSLR